MTHVMTRGISLTLKHVFVKTQFQAITILEILHIWKFILSIVVPQIVVFIFCQLPVFSFVLIIVQNDHNFCDEMKFL